MILNLKTSKTFEKNWYVLPSLTLGAVDEVKNIFENLVQAMDWNYATFVLIQDEISSSYQYFTDYISFLKNRKACFNIQIGHNKELDTLIKTVKKQNEAEVIVLLGSPINQAMFLRDYGPSNKTWYLNENYRIISQTGMVIRIRDIRYEVKQKLLPILNGHALTFFNRFEGLSSYHKNHFTAEYTMKLYEDLHFFILTYREKAKAKDVILSFMKLVVRQNFYFRRLRIDVNGHKMKNNGNITELGMSMMPYKRLSQCPPVHCQSGSEYVYTKLNNYTTIWNESYRWVCQPCANGFFKSRGGNSSCIPCPAMHVSNKDRKSCYDPYKEQMISISQPFTIFAITLSCFGLLSCFVVALGFIKYRTTPMMKAANVQMTFVHLFFFASNFVLLFFSFYSKPNIYKCYGRLLTLTVFYTIIVSIIQLRLQKVLKAFQSRVKMTKSEIRRSKMAEVFSVLILVFVNNFILFLLVYVNPVKMVNVINHKTFDKISHCNIGSHFKVLIGFTICLQFVCFIQAFRGRRLPGAFKETMSIVYGSFMVILIFIVLYPIVIFQKDILQAESVYWIAIALSMDLLIIFCYFRRIYIAVFHPEMNTIEYSRSVIMAKMSKDSKNKIRT
ncbi:extracellular calcium-sensing receptor-like [Clytia hemisphaerica]|uniref:extracellular calcium-sensing receptor-like n=1 Tax=Clytia hemisphaerica TaxID=252671 RepID=UPI0034D75F85